MKKITLGVIALLGLAMAFPASAEMVKATFSGDLVGSFTYNSEAEPFSTESFYQFGENVSQYSFGRQQYLTYDIGLEGGPVSLDEREFHLSVLHFLDRDQAVLMLSGPDFDIDLYAWGTFPTYGLPTSASVTESYGIANIGPRNTADIAHFEFNVNFAPLYPAAVSSVPEPATWAMMLVGFATVGAGMRRRRWKAISPLAPPLGRRVRTY